MTFSTNRPRRLRALLITLAVCLSWFAGQLSADENDAPPEQYELQSWVVYAEHQAILVWDPAADEFVCRVPLESMAVIYGGVAIQEGESITLYMALFDGGPIPPRDVTLKIVVDTKTGESEIEHSSAGRWRGSIEYDRAEGVAALEIPNARSRSFPGTRLPTATNAAWEEWQPDWTNAEIGLFGRHELRLMSGADTWQDRMERDIWANNRGEAGYILFFAPPQLRQVLTDDQLADLAEWLRGEIGQDDRAIASAPQVNRRKLEEEKWLRELANGTAPITLLNERNAASSKAKFESATLQQDFSGRFAAMEFRRYVHSSPWREAVVTGEGFRPLANFEHEARTRFNAKGLPAVLFIPAIVEIDNESTRSAAENAAAAISEEDAAR